VYNGGMDNTAHSPVTDWDFWKNYFEWQQMLMQADLQGAKFNLEITDQATGQKQKFNHVRLAPGVGKRS
jgi:hypothetical protein